MDIHSALNPKHVCKIQLLIAILQVIKSVQTVLLNSDLKVINVPLIVKLKELRTVLPVILLVLKLCVLNVQKELTWVRMDPVM